MYTDDGGELDDRLRAVAGHLTQSSEELQRALDDVRARTFHVASVDGTVEMTVDGNSRVVGVVLRTRDSGRDPDQLDRELTDVLNEALTLAREHTRQAVLDALPPRVRHGVQDVVDETGPEDGR